MDDCHSSQASSAEDVCLPKTSDDVSAVPFPVDKDSTSNSTLSSGRGLPGPHPDHSPRHHRTTKGSVNTSFEPIWNTPKATESFTEDDLPSYQVHGGMLRLARAMGSKGKPVHQAVSAALSRNRGYGWFWLISTRHNAELDGGQSLSFVDTL